MTVWDGLRVALMILFGALLPYAVAVHVGGAAAWIAFAVGVGIAWVIDGGPGKVNRY